MEELKKLLGEELFKQVEEKLGDKKIDIVSDGQWIPKQKFDDVNKEKNGYKEQIETLNTELGKLKKAADDNKDIQEKIEKLEKEIGEKETAMEALRKSGAIKLEVLKANPKDINDILPHIDENIIKINDDGITGLQEQIDRLKKDKEYLFNETEPAGTGGSKGGGAKDKKDPPEKSIADMLLEQRKQQAEETKAVEDIYFKED